MHITHLLFSCLFMIFLLLPTRQAVCALDPTEIIRQMEATMRGDSSYAEMVMRIERPRYSREVALRSWAKEQTHSLIFISAPARDRGTVYLMRDRDIWTYDPRIDRTTRLPSSMMAQSWMGSDFSNDDLVRDTNIVTDFEHRLLRTETYQERDCFVIEMIPKPETPVVWGKVKVWVTTDSFLQLRVENYDQRGKLANSMVLDQITRFGDREIPARITVTPADKEQERTILQYKTIEFNIEIDDDFFTRATMQRMR